MPPFNNFTTKAKEAVRRAHELAIERGQNHVSPMHLLAALVLQEESLVFSILDRMEVDTIMLADSVLEHLETPERSTVLSPSYQIYLTPELAQALETSGKIAARMNDTFVGTEHLFLAVIEHPGSASDILSRFNIGRDAAAAILKELKTSRTDRWLNETFRALAKYARTNQARFENKLTGHRPRFGNKQGYSDSRASHEIIQSNRRGGWGDGDCRGTAARMATGDIPEMLKGGNCSARPRLMIAGTKYRGEFEERMKNVMKEVER